MTPRLHDSSGADFARLALAEDRAVARIYRMAQLVLGGLALVALAALAEHLGWVQLASAPLAGSLIGIAGFAVAGWLVHRAETLRRAGLELRLSRLELREAMREPDRRADSAGI